MSSDSLNKVDLIIVAGPSGVGKSTMVERVCKEVPHLFDTVTYTTRSMRKGESEGQPYYFVSEDEFKEKVAQGFFVEWAVVHNKYYGTPKQQIEDAILSGKKVIMDVDVQGAATFKEKYPHSFLIFINPPSIDELRHRIRKRGKMSDSELAIRLENARKEMALSESFDIQIINADFELSYSQFKKIIEEIVKNR
jgi:guanylate kinase